MASGDYASKTELINDLVRRARQRDEEQAFARKKLDNAERGRLTPTSKDEIRPGRRRAVAREHAVYLRAPNGVAEIMAVTRH